MTIRKTLVAILLCAPLQMSLASSVQAAAAEEGYKAISSAAAGYRTQLQPLIDQAKRDYRGYASLDDSNDPMALRAAAAKLAESVDAANREIFPMTLLARQINAEYPDLEAMKNISLAGADAAAEIGSLNSLLESWDKWRLDKADNYVQKAEGEVVQTESQLSMLASLPPQVRGAMVGQYVGFLKTAKAFLVVAPILLPEPPKEIGVRSAKANELLQRANALQPRIAKAEAQMSGMSASAKEELRRELEAARFPANLVRNEADEALIIAAFRKKYGDIKVERIGIKQSWQEKTEARWAGSALVVNTYKYIYAWLAHKTDSGKYYTYSMSFRKTLQSDGSWSDLAHYGVGYAYEVLEENLHK